MSEALSQSTRDIVPMGRKADGRSLKSPFDEFIPPFRRQDPPILNVDEEECNTVPLNKLRNEPAIRESCGVIPARSQQTLEIHPYDSIRLDDERPPHVRQAFLQAVSYQRSSSTLALRRNELR
jgi:hypothetical protein